MKNKFLKSLSLVLCAAIIVGGIGTAYAVNSNKESENATSHRILTNKDEDKISKDETVYVIAGAEGEIKKIIVSDWIKNSIKAQTVTDRSELTDIENVKGQETYTIDSENSRVWDAQGNDIYYKGNIEKELPVSINVSYKLDGKVLSPSELAGKSGKLTIRFDYENNQYEMKKINGKEERVYVPFAIFTGMLFDNQVFTNVEVSNGKLINDGDRTAVVGFAFPGLQEDLGINAEKFEIPNYVEITADVKNFEMMNTISITTNEVFNQIDTQEIDSAEELKRSIGELSKAMSQLLDGSSELYDGLYTLLNKSNQLIEGIDQLACGAKELKNGAGKLDNGAKELSDGAKSLANGLDELNNNSETLNSGSKEVFASLLSMADAQLKQAGLDVPKLTIENYAKVLNQIITSLDETQIANKAYETALKSVTQAVNAQKNVIEEKVTEAVQAQITKKVSDMVYNNVENQVLDSLGMTQESYDKGVADGTISAEQQKQIESEINKQVNSDAVRATISANVEMQMKTDEVKGIVSAKTDEEISKLIDMNMNSAEVQAQITQALEKAKSGAESVSALKEQLDRYNAFYTGLNMYTQGVNDAKQGAEKLNIGAAQLQSGATELYAGMGELYDGVVQLKNGAPALIDGVTKLRDGAMQLSEGLKEFNERGVNKLIDAVDGDLGGLIERIKVTADVSKNYKSFSGISDDMEGEVKFIYRTDSISMNEEKED